MSVDIPKFPLASLHVNFYHEKINGITTTAYGIASQKGLYFTIARRANSQSIGNVLFGRDGVNRQVNNTYRAESWLHVFKYMLLSRLFAIFDVIQFLIFGTLMLLFTVCVSVINMIAILILFFGIWHEQIRTLWYILLFGFYTGLCTIILHVFLYAMLPFEIIVPELVFRVFKIHQFGYQIDSELPL
jgi:hypothetical protein